ncbi:expressed unknown protein [Ectocarpus siliculosus]|uniref:Uncharacterized protein n=1 Tax=Ectocarpus siliculosus TaxID=2880 RepID=D8LT44_ECTSI|nr:expressed unknown protein [Ectocarpus siliculosus]|eukprot:CBN75318.1 expressed unknown protein [Ectocarpus siliculosus]
MWKPEEVVPRHKRRAVLLWTTLIVGIISYSTYTLYRGLKRREDPGTTFKLSNNIYQYPDLWVCLYVNYGCDEMELQEECVNSSNATEGGETLAVFYPGGEYEQVIPGEQILSKDKGFFCVEYETSTITTFLGQEPETGEYLDHILLDMSWYPGGYNDSKTCLAEGWGTHNEWIYITFKDAGTGSLSSEIPLPYTCITNGSTSREFTHVGIEVTKVERLSGDIDVTFEAKSVITTTQKIEVGCKGGYMRPVGYDTHGNGLSRARCSRKRYRVQAFHANVGICRDNDQQR